VLSEKTSKGRRKTISEVSGSCNGLSAQLPAAAMVCQHSSQQLQWSVSTAPSSCNGLSVQLPAAAMVCQHSSQQLQWSVSTAPSSCNGLWAQLPAAVRPVPPYEVSRPAVVTKRPSIQSALGLFVWDAIMTTHLILMQRIRMYAVIPLSPQKSYNHNAQLSNQQLRLP